MPEDQESLQAKMKARAERFGVPLASKPDAKPTTAAVPKSKTAPKALAKAPLSVSVDSDLIEKRKAKFGIVESPVTKSPKKEVKKTSFPGPSAPEKVSKKAAKKPAAVASKLNVVVDAEIAKKRAESALLMENPMQELKSSLSINRLAEPSVPSTTAAYKPKTVSKGQLKMIIPSFRKQENAVKVDFEGVVRVFTDKHAKKLYSRQVDVLNKIIAIYSQGVPLEDVSSFSKLLSTLNVSIRNDIAVIPQTMELIKLLRLYPGVDLSKNVIQLSQMGCKEMEKTVHDAQELLDTVSDLIVTIDDGEFIHHATEAIYKICGGVSNNQTGPNLVKIHFKTASFSQETVPIINEIANFEESGNADHFLRAAEKSHVATKLVQKLAYSKAEATRFGIFKCLRRLSRSPIISATLAKEDHLKFLFDVLAEDFEKDNIVFSCYEVIWNILESPGNSKTAVSYFEKEHPFEIMKLMVDKATQSSTQLISKQRRNESLVLCEKIIHLSPQALKISRSVQFLDLVFELLTQKKTLIKRSSLTDCLEDFHFMRTLISCTKKMLDDPESLTYLINNGILSFCNLLIGSDPKSQIYLLWDVTQRSVLQISVLGLLATLIPHTAKEFRSISGPLHLVNFLEYLIDFGSKIDQKRVDLMRIHVSLLRSTLLCILKLSEGGPVSKKILGQLNTFKSLLKILSEPNQDSLIWRKCLIICSSLCQGFKANRQIFGDSGGVPIVLPFLSYNSSDPTEYELVILSAVECIWGTICGNITFEDSFIQNDGVYQLLELLESGSYKVRKHTLGCLLDLLENPNAISHVLYWRTKKDSQKGIGHLLISIWNSEEERLGVTHGPNGELIKNVKFPLKSGINNDSSQILLTKERHENHPAIMELEQNLKAKIYSLFCKIGTSNLPGALSAEEKIKLSMISKYLDFKVYEVWDEITEEFKLEGVRPISPDLDCINCVEDIAKKKIQLVLDSQLEILRSSQQTSKNEEKSFFSDWIHEFAAEEEPVMKPRLHKWRQSLWADRK